MSYEPFSNTALTIPLRECHTCGKKYNFSHPVWECQEYSKLTYLLHMNKKANTPMKTPFEAGKTAKELGIDTSRKFVVVSNGKGEIFRTGDIVKLSGSAPFAVEPGATFQNKQGDEETMFWRELAYADDVAEPVREEERLLGYDVGKEGGDETVALYGKRHEDGSVEITKTVRGLPLETPYEPRVGDHASDDEEFKALLGDMLDSVSQSVKKLNAALDEALVRLSRKPPRTLTKAEAEALLTEKLGESVRIE